MLPVVRGTNTHVDTIEVHWSELTGHATGGVPIDSYNLQWDKGSNEVSWYDLIGEDTNYYTGTSFTFTEEIIPGSTYKMRIRAHNLHGWGEWSDVSIVLSTGIPDKPDPLTSVKNNIYIRFSWTDPDHNFEAIDSYSILFQHVDRMSFSAETDYCDGTDPLIILRKYCEVPLSVFITDPFELIAGDLIVAKVAAHNLNGWGEYSDENDSGAVVETVPH
jgi:hypothetical protein